MLNAADVIAQRLHGAGCRHAFGIPGGEVLTLVESLGQAGIAFHLTKHENCAGFMAEGVFHATGAPGVLVATLGPGVLNAVNVVANAWQDRVPLIFLTGCVDAADAHAYTHQVLDHGAVLGPVTKASLSVADGAAEVVIDKALAIATDGQPGPVHVDLPIDVAARAQRGAGRRPRPAPAPAAPAAGADLEAARAALREAERPLIIAGVDVLNQGAEAVVARTAEALGIPLVTTYKAKGVLTEDHPLCLGGAGLSPKADAILLPLVKRSDLLVLVGYDPIEMRAGWRDPWDDGARVVELCAVPNTHYVHRARWSFVGDVGAGLAVLTAGATPRASWPGGEVAAAQSALREAFSADEDWGAAAVVDVARRALPREAVVTVDSGAHRILLSQMWRCYAPRTLLQSTGLCTMGCAVPLAAGFKLARGERPVAAFVGDAGLEMVLGELATLRDLELPVVVVVFVDRSLALIELKQRGAGMREVGVGFGATDFAGVARALGGRGVAVADRESLERALGEALEHDRFTVIACDIGPRPYDGRF